MKLKEYKIEGITEKDISAWSNELRDDIKIFSISSKGKRKIKIFVELTKIEALKIKFQLFVFNLKYKTKITIKSCK